MQYWRDVIVRMNDVPLIIDVRQHASAEVVYGIGWFLLFPPDGVFPRSMAAST